MYKDKNGAWMLRFLPFAGEHRLYRRIGDLEQALSG
jgi:hypothetical protein